jgi:hypothetical protein
MDLNKIKEIRGKSFLYEKINDKYIKNTLRNDLIKNEIEYYVKTIKEIDLLEKNNKKIINDVHEYFIEIIFKGIENNEIDAFEDENLKNKISIYEIKNKMLRPINPEMSHKKKNIYFRFEDISLIEIISNYVKTIRYPKPIFDNLVFKIKIPAEKIYDMNIERTICCFRYKDITDFLKNKNYKIVVNNISMFFGDALEKNIFKYIYLFIDDIDINEKYKINKNDFYGNNKIAFFILQNIKNKLKL